MKRIGAAVAVAVMAASIGLLSTAGAVAAIPTATVPEETSGGLSETGQDAIGDLRTCLDNPSVPDVLNVYYLIDASGSLNPDIMGDDAASDKDTLRAPILSNSLEQLGGLDGDATVYWNAGFFNELFITSSEIGWTVYEPGAEDGLTEAIERQYARGDTNWPDALAHAQASLSDQHAENGGCQLLIWLTDGQLDFRDGPGDEQEILDSLNAMCGATLADGGAPPSSENGIFNSLRQSGVVVIGALLATNEAAAKAGQVMRPLVEGSATVDGETVTCGVPLDPLPEGYVRGAFVEAVDATALALLFMQLGAQIGGGNHSGFAEDGSFFIDPGVSRFSIGLSGTWTLTSPDGTEVTAGIAAPRGMTVGSSVVGDETLTEIEVTITRDAQYGKWRLVSGDKRWKVLFSDLSIEFEDKNEVGVNEDGEIDATLKAQVVRRDGTPASVEIFGTKEFQAWLRTAEGPVLIADTKLDPATGEIEIPLPANVSTAQITVKASIDPLKTDEHDLELAPVTNERTVDTVLPDSFPMIAELPVALSDLVGASSAPVGDENEASGTIKVNGPKTGGTGWVCIPDDPSVISPPSAERDGGSWHWDVTEDLGPDRCVEVPEHAQGQEIQIRVTNEVAEDAQVRATVNVVFRSSEGGQLDRDVGIEFRSTHPVNQLAVGLIALALLLLGILLPLLALWLLNWRTTRLDIDNGIQRASFRVRIGPGGVAFADVPASDSALAERFQYRPPQRNVRSVDDPDLGRLAAHVPWFPLAEPTYRITPRPGASIIGARTSARAASAGVRRDDGSMEFRQLPLDAFWAVLVSNADLARTKRGDEVNGTAVLYHRMDPSQQDQYRARLNDIGLEGSLTDAVDRTRAGLAEAQAKQNAKKSSKGGDTPSTAAPPTPGAPGRDGAPPPRGGATPPPREAGAPPRDGTPPPRGGTAPPSRGGTTPPPRPGSSGPPPLPGSPPHGSPPPRPGSPPPRGR